MKIKKLLYPILCAVGGAMVGISAGKLDSIIWGVVWCIGVFLLVFSIVKASK